MASTFDWKPGELQQGLFQFPGKVNQAVSALVDFHATRAEAHMKTTAPWTDQTGAARSGLFTDTQHELTRHYIILAHAVNYGIWLETRRDFHGRYQVILPSLKVIGDELMRSLSLLLGKIE